ncbi:MAG: hypothetical protein Q4D34_04880 [Eggerthellaceae bacterium]|nr:hypothetical protein [Eggerthellaceae bacterium]
MEDKQNNGNIDQKSQDNRQELENMLEPVPEYPEYKVEEPQPAEEEYVDMKVARDFKNIRLYLQIAGICAPVSLVIGGVLLGTVALIFAILGFRKLYPYTKRNDELGATALNVRKYAILALVVSAACIIANAVFVITNWSQLEGMITQGMSTFQLSGGSSGSASGGGTSSTWG